MGPGSPGAAPQPWPLSLLLPVPKGGPGCTSLWERIRFLAKNACQLPFKMFWQPWIRNTKSSFLFLFIYIFFFFPDWSPLVPLLIFIVFQSTEPFLSVYIKCAEKKKLPSVSTKQMHVYLETSALWIKNYYHSSHIHISVSLRDIYVCLVSNDVIMQKLKFSYRRKHILLNELRTFSQGLAFLLYVWNPTEINGPIILIGSFGIRTSFFVLQ